MREIIGTTKNGFAVIADYQDSHFATHAEKTPKLDALVREALPHLALHEDYQKFRYDFGRLVGEYDLVEIKPTDTVWYAIRKNRDAYIPFVVRPTRPTTSCIIVHLKKTGAKEAEIFTAYIGVITPNLPGNEFEESESRHFWSSHALVWGSQEVDESTVTDVCPW